MFSKIKNNKTEILKELKKIFWIFFIASILGDLIEMFFVWLSTGHLMSRSSLFYGAFALTWGGAAAILSLAYIKLKHKNDLKVFIIGLIFGSFFEYMCSVASELHYGFVFWDYSHLKFNLNGRIYLPFCIAWGLFSVLWIKYFYPKIKKWLNPITDYIPYWITLGALLLFLFNIVLSASVLDRYGDRIKGVEAHNRFERWLDVTYPDELVKNRYQNIHYK